MNQLVWISCSIQSAVSFCARAHSWFIGLILYFSNSIRSYTSNCLQPIHLLIWFLVNLFLPFLSGVLCLLFHVFFFQPFVVLYFVRYYLCVAWTFCVGLLQNVLWLIDSPLSQFNVGSAFIMHMLACSLDFLPVYHSIRCMFIVNREFRRIIRSFWSVFRCWYKYIFFLFFFRASFLCFEPFFVVVIVVKLLFKFVSLSLVSVCAFFLICRV